MCMQFNWFSQLSRALYEFNTTATQRVNRVKELQFHRQDYEK